MKQLLGTLLCPTPKASGSWGTAPLHFGEVLTWTSPVAGGEVESRHIRAMGDQVWNFL